MKFKVNDRVKYVGDLLNLPFGSVGSILDPTDDRNVKVWFDSQSGYNYCYEWSLELVEPVVPDYETGVQEAQRLVYGNRNADYGHPADDFERTGKMWSAILGVEVTAKQAALCMAAVKISRECNKPKRDNLVDLAGYAEVALRIQRKLDGEEPN